MKILPFITQFFTIKLIYSIFSISGIIKFLQWNNHASTILFKAAFDRKNGVLMAFKCDI